MCLLLCHTLSRGRPDSFPNHLLAPRGAAYRQLAAQVAATTPRIWVRCEVHAIGSSCRREFGVTAVALAACLGTQAQGLCCTLCVLRFGGSAGPFDCLGLPAARSLLVQSCVYMVRPRLLNMWRGHACTCFWPGLPKAFMVMRVHGEAWILERLLVLCWVAGLWRCLSTRGLLSGAAVLVCCCCCCAVCLPGRMCLDGQIHTANLHAACASVCVYVCALFFSLSLPVCVPPCLVMQMC